MDSESVKKAVMQQVLQENAQANARMIMENVNKNCFESCVTKPGSALSSTEKTCAVQCMERYVAAWNVVHETYMARVKEQANSQ
ncbi:mitochondrial import inner membrane translocase subunit tim13 [Ophiostoma piceae UAMH 11346]|uniref:Mitochondrial import inner membrane translocase subunit n=1 Tax=Ophiostoma piceae (strain UAMH 11346) TaxID=1262450 RepID=S3CU64_OPHP1|nr:mitochondrial import inner membrane translocase subunit tim13 [Ophiostoma piceae UAMH 11346]